MLPTCLLKKEQIICCAHHTFMVVTHILIYIHLCRFQSSSAIDLTDKMIIDLKDPNRPCFTKQEVRDLLFEKNELKANLFLVKEELAYYQR